MIGNLPSFLFLISSNSGHDENQVQPKAYLKFPSLLFQLTFHFPYLLTFITVVSHNLLWPLKFITLRSNNNNSYSIFQAYYGARIELVVLITNFKIHNSSARLRIIVFCFTDEETKFQRVSVLPKLMQLASVRVSTQH